MAINKTRLALVSPDFTPLRSQVASLLRPILQRWINEEGLDPAEKDPRRLEVFETPFDPRCMTYEGPVVAALWKGYHPAELAYLRAHNDALNFWFVPTPNLLPSLFYFLGLQGEEYTPRISTMIPSLADVTRIAGRIDSYKWVKSRTGRLTGMPRVPVIGLWYDYDGDPSYQRKVQVFLRIFSLMQETLAKQDHPINPVAFVLFSEKEVPFSFEDAGIDEQHIIVAVTAQVDVFRSTATRYVSFDDNPTSFDPMCLLFNHGQTDEPPLVISPARMDMLSMRYQQLPPSLLNLLAALLSPGSPGPNALLNMFLPIYTELVALTKDD